MVHGEVLVLLIRIGPRGILCLFADQLIVEGIISVLHLKIAQLELLTPKIYVFFLS